MESREQTVEMAHRDGMASVTDSIVATVRARADEGYEIHDVEDPRMAQVRDGRTLWRTVIFTLLGIAVCAAAANEAIDYALRLEIEAKRFSTPDPLLAAIRAAETDRLTRYRWVNKSEGIARIPLDRAKRRVIDEYRRAALAASIDPAPSGVALPSEQGWH